MADDQREQLSAAAYYAPAQGAPVQSPDDGAGLSAADYFRSYTSWYGGRNLQGTESGWSTDFFRRATEQRNEQYERQAASGNPGDFYDWFQREDATGVATWNDSKRMVRAEDGRLRGLRAGDVFDGGRFVHNVYDVYDRRDADLMVGEFVFDGDQKARLFEQDAKDPGALSKELDGRIAENTKRAVFGVQSYETRERTQEKARELDRDLGWLDEIGTVAAGAGGGALALSWLGPAGWIAGSLIGGTAALLNVDQFNEATARAVVQAERAEEQGIGASGAWFEWAGTVGMQAISPLSNAIAGAYEVVEGDWNDGLSDFNAVDPVTGERLASGWWQAAHLAAALPDSFLQFTSRAAVTAYQAALVGHVSSRAVNLSQDMVWADAEGGWHKFEDWGERSQGWAALGIDALQLGVSQWAVRAAQGARQAAGVVEGAATPVGGALRKVGLADDTAGRLGDEAWSRLPGLSFRGRSFSTVKADQRAAYRARSADDVRRPELASGSRFMFDEAGRPIAARTTAVAFVPSEMLRWLPAQMQARYKAIRQGRSPNEVAVEDLYEASLRWAGNGGRAGDAMILGTAEGFEEAVQYALDTGSYSGIVNAEEMARAAAYGFMSGVGMGIGPMLGRPAREANEKEDARILESLRTGTMPGLAEWDAKWGSMSEVERRRAASGSRDQMDEARSIRLTIAERRRAEANRNGVVPAMIVQRNVEAAADADAMAESRLPEGSAQARLLPNELFATGGDERGGVLFRRPRYRASAAGMSAQKMLTDYQAKRKGLQQHLRSLPDDAPGREELEVEIAVIGAIIKTVRENADHARTLAPDDVVARSRRELEAVRKHISALERSSDLGAANELRRAQDEAAELERLIQEPAAARLAYMRKLNRILERYAIEGAWGGEGATITIGEGAAARQVVPSRDVVRRAGRIIYSRHPYIERGSFFVSVPQIYPPYEFNNVNGVIAIGLNAAKAAQLDFDGDNLKEIPSVLFPAVLSRDGRRFLPDGSQFLVDGPARTGKGPGDWWEVNIDRPKDEKEMINSFHVVLNPVMGERTDPREAAFLTILGRLRDGLRDRYGDLLVRDVARDGSVRDPFAALWKRFMDDIAVRNPESVMKFMTGFVNHSRGAAGEALIRMGEETGEPEILVMAQMFTTGLQNASLTLKTMDPARTAEPPPGTSDPILEVNRAYIAERDMRDAATVAQTLALIGGPEGNRASSKLRYDPVTAAAVDTVFNNVADMQTDQFRALAREFFLSEGAGVADSAEERVEAKNSTVNRVVGWMQDLGRALYDNLEASARTLDIMPEKGLEFMAASLRAPDAHLDENGEVVVLPIGEQNDKVRSDTSLAQQMLRESVRRDVYKHRVTRKDDPVHNNLRRLGSMAGRKGVRSISASRTLRELYGDVPSDELLGENYGAQFGTMTMNQWIAQLRVMSKDQADAQIDFWKGRGEAYVSGKGDAPWSLAEVKALKLNPYTLFVDTVAAVSRAERKEMQERAAKPGESKREAFSAIRDTAAGVLRTDPNRIRTFFGKEEGARIDMSHALEYVLYQRDMGAMAAEIFPERASHGTVFVRDGQLVSNPWMSEAFARENPHDAELMVMVESAIDLLKAEGARINRGATRKSVEGKVLPVGIPDMIESRLAILINRLAAMPTSVELDRFFKMYDDLLEEKGGENKVQRLFDMINREKHWLQGEAELVPYFDSIKDFERDPRNLWNSGTMYTQEHEALIGLGDRMRMTSSALLKQVRAERDDTAYIAQLRNAHELIAAGKTPDAGIQLEYERLDRQRKYALEVAPVHGQRMRTSTTIASGEIVDMSDKGQASSLLEAMGTAYVLSTASNMQTAMSTEVEAAASFSSKAVMDNPDLLLRGPVEVMVGKGRVVPIDLTTMDGLIKALEVPGMRNLVYAAVFHTEYDTDANGAPRLYAKYAPGTPLKEMLEDGVNQTVMGFDEKLSRDQGQYVLGAFEGRVKRLGQEDGSPGAIQRAFVPFQRVLNNVFVARTTKPGWKTLGDTQREVLAEQDQNELASLLVKMSQIRSDEAKEEFLRLLQAGFVARWRETQGLPHTLQEMVDEISGDDPTSELARVELIRTIANLSARRTADAAERANRFQQMQAEVEQAENKGDDELARRLRRSMQDAGLTEASVKQELKEATEQSQRIADGLYSDVRMDAAMITYRAAYQSFITTNADKSEHALIKRQRVIKAVLDLERRLQGKLQEEVRFFLDTYRAQRDALSRGEVEAVTDDMWKRMAIISAKQAVADRAGATGSSIMFALAPDEKEENGFHYWDESFSFLVRPLLDPQVLEASRWFAELHGVPEMSSKDAAAAVLDSGLFRKEKFGKWNPLIVSNMVNMQRAMEGASVTLAVPIGGDLPKTMFDVSVVTYSDFDAPIDPAKHHSTMELMVSPPPGWDGEGEPPFHDWLWLGKDSHRDWVERDPLAKLNMHFVKSFDAEEIHRRVQAALASDGVLEKFFMRRYGYSEEKARDAVAELKQPPSAVPDPDSKIPVGWATPYQEEIDRIAADIRRQIDEVFYEYPEARTDGYRVFDALRFADVLRGITDLTGTEPFTITLEYVDIDKRPFTPEYRNHGLFDGVGRRSSLETNISPIGAALFGVGAFSKQTQQQVFDYASRGGTSYKPYYPTKMTTYKAIIDKVVADEQARAAAENRPAFRATVTIRAVAAALMAKEYAGHDSFLVHDQAMAYKLAATRYVYYGLDPQGRSRYMWSEEVASLENDPANAGWDTSSLKLIRTSEDIQRRLLGSYTKQTGPEAVSRPEWRLENIDMNPSLDADRLLELGLEDLGMESDGSDTELALMTPLSRRTRVTSGNMEEVRTTLRKKVEEGLRVRGNVLTRRSADTAENLRRSEVSQRLLLRIQDEITAETLQYFRDQMKVSLNSHASVALTRAADLIEVLRKSGASQPSSRAFYLGTDKDGDPALNRFTTSDVERWEKGEFTHEDPTWGDVVAVNLLAILHRNEKNTDRATEEIIQTLTAIGKTGARVVLVAPGNPFLLDQVLTWLDGGQMGYTAHEGSRYIWEPITPDNIEGATELALRSSLTAVRTLEARNAHVTAHLLTLGGNLADNAGQLFRPEHLKTPVKHQYLLVPTTLEVAKFGTQKGEFIFTFPDRGTKRYRDNVEQLQQMVAQPDARAEMRMRASEMFLPENGEEDSDDYQGARIWGSQQVADDRGPDPDPRNVELYRRFEETDSELLGIRSFEDAWDRFVDTLKKGELPLQVQDSGLRAGDFFVKSDGKDNILIGRLGFELPGLQDLQQIFAGGRKIGIVSPKIDKSTIIPPDFRITARVNTEKGKDFEIEVPLSTWAKVVMGGDGTKYTLSPAMEQFLLPDVTLGRNGRDITFGNSAGEQESKNGYTNRADKLKGIFAIAGMDEVRLPLVNVLLRRQYRSINDKGFDKDWNDTLSVLNRWAAYDFGMDDDEIAEKLNLNQLFTSANIDLQMSLTPVLQEMDPSIREAFEIPVFDKDWADTDVETKIVMIYLAALSSRRIKPIHITRTPGVWTVDRPLSSEAGIIMMPDLFIDAIARDDAVANYFIERANARIQRFPDGHPLEGRPVGRWDETGRFFWWVQEKLGDDRLGEWIELDAWLSIDIPSAASQNPATYANIDYLAQKGGFTRHVAAVLLLAANARMLYSEPAVKVPSRLDQIFDGTQVRFEDDPMAALNRVFTTWAEADVTGDSRPTPLLEMQQEFMRKRAQESIVAFEEFEFAIDRTGDKWKESNAEIEKLILDISAKVGIGSVRLGKYMDWSIRMFYGYPGPIGKDQDAWYERVSPEVYIEGLQYFKSQLDKNLDPMTGGAIPIMHPDFAAALFNAGKWAPLRKWSTNRKELATTWDDWTRSIFGQWVDSKIPVEEWWGEEWDGLLQKWKRNNSVLGGLGLSLDTIRDLLPKNRQINEQLNALDALTDGAIVDPLILDAWDTVDAAFTGRRTAEDIEVLKNAKYTQAEFSNRQRRQWAAKKQMPQRAKKRMTTKDYAEFGALYIDKRVEQGKFFTFLTNAMHINRLADPAIFVSGFVEQPVRMMFEHLTDLLTGRYTGPGAQSLARMLGSERIKKITDSSVFADLGFGDFKQTFTAEDLQLIDRMAAMLGDDVRWLSLLHQDTQYVNDVAKAGEGKWSRGAEKLAGGVARSFSDPTYGSSQPVVAKRYLMGVIEHLHATGQQVSLKGLAVELRKNPLFLEEQYGDVGLTPHKAGMNRVLQVRSQRLVPFSRAVSRSINYLTSHPKASFKALGFALNVPFAYVRFTANGLSFVSGMDGWSQAAAMFFAGRRRPKFLGGGKRNNETYWDLEDILETIDLRHTFVRSGVTMTMLFTLGMMAGGTFGFLGENEEERRRRRQAMYSQLVDVKDPNEPKNNFLNADAIFLDSVPILSAMFDDGKGSSAIIPHWVVRQFTSPILGMSRFFETGDFREIGYGFLDAFSALPHSMTRLWDEADATASMLFAEAKAAEEEGTATGVERMNSLLITALSVYERALIENQFINNLIIGADKYDRDPFKVPMEPGAAEGPHLDPMGNPLPTKALEQYYDPESGEVKNTYLTRSGADAAMHQYAENNVVFGALMHLITGMDEGYLRKDMVVKRRSIDLGETDEARAEATIYALYLQNGGASIDALTKDEIAYALKGDATRNDIYWNEDDIDAQAQALYESHQVGEGALSFMSPQGEVLTEWGGDRIIDGIAKGTIKLGGPQLAGVAMPPEMRDRLAATIQQRLFEDGVKLGLPEKTAEYRARRIWYGEDDRPEVPGLREIVYSDQIPYSSTVRYNQLNVTYMMGPDGKPWATPFERKTVSQAFLPTPHNMVTPGTGLNRDERGMTVDEVLGINTGLAGLERIPEMPTKLEPNDEPFKISADSGESGRYSRPWRRYGGGGGGGGGSSYTPQMRPLPGGIAARFDGLQMINTSNPILRRANVNRQRIWTERGRLKQWQ